MKRVRNPRPPRSAPQPLLGVLVTSISLLLSASSDAQDPMRVELDRAAYLERVAEDAPSWLAAPERHRVATAHRGVARTRPTPGLVAGLAQLDVSGQGAPTSSLVGFDVPIELGGDRARRVAEADARIVLTDAEVEAQSRELLVTAALAYVDALAARANVETRSRLRSGYAQVAALDATRLERGEITEAQSLRSSIESDRAEVELQAAQDAVTTYELALGRYLVSEHLLRVGTTGTLATTHEAHDDEALVAEAIAVHPSLVAANARVEVAHAALARVRASRVVDPTLRVEWQHYGSTTVAQFRQRANDTIAVLLGVPFPVTAPRRADVALAQAEIDAAEAALATLRRRVEADVRVAAAAERETSRRAESYEAVLLPRARSLVEAMTRAYEHGAATAFELISARRTLEEVELAAVQARADLARAHVALAASVRGAP